ncbi:MAG: hypothetical protein ACREX9_16660 [Gammaproteobacteria bacterium]
MGREAGTESLAERPEQSFSDRIVVLVRDPLVGMAFTEVPDGRQEVFDGGEAIDHRGDYGHELGPLLLHVAATG